MFSRFSLRLILLTWLAGNSCLWPATLSLDHEATIKIDFGGMRMPRWSGGALVNFISNRTASPVLLSFDSRGKQLKSLSFTVPGSEKVDLDDITRGLDGALAICLRLAN
jgi:hypothetical protein